MKIIIMRIHRHYFHCRCVIWLVYLLVCHTELQTDELTEFSASFTRLKGLSSSVISVTCKILTFFCFGTIIISSPTLNKAKSSTCHNYVVTMQLYSFCSILKHTGIPSLPIELNSKFQGFNLP